MWQWIKGTVRPICLLAGFPVLAGALVSGTPIEWDIFYAIGAAMYGVGYANSFNSVIDRHLDRLNPAKNTLAKEKPLAAWYGVLFLLPPLAFCLRSNSYNHCLFAMLYYLCFVYSYALGRVRIVKRITVAAIIALTSLLYVKTLNLYLWLLMAAEFAYFYTRESRKDRDDKVEDEKMRFVWRGNNLDWWCLCAPLLAVGIYLGCLNTAGCRPGLAQAVVSFGMALSVWSYIQIRYRYRRYKMKLLHQTTSGRLGIVMSLVGLMPSFVNPAFILVVMINTSSIIYRSFFSRKIIFSKAAIIHDSLLWASLPLLAMTTVGYQPGLAFASVALGLITFIGESRRLDHLRDMSNVAAA